MSACCCTICLHIVVMLYDISALCCLTCLHAVANCVFVLLCLRAFTHIASLCAVVCLQAVSDSAICAFVSACRCRCAMSLIVSLCANVSA